VLQLQSQDSLPLLHRCEALFGLRQWERAFESLGEIITERLPAQRHSFTAIIDLILRLSEGREDHRKHVAALISTFSQARILALLGDALIWSLRQIDTLFLDPRTLHEWRDDWLELGAGRRDLKLPLRIFRGGVEYVIHEDEKILLKLVSAERKILREALGIDEPEAYDLPIQFG
jgi:hypothetical protein